MSPTPWGDLVTSIEVKDGKIVSVDIPTFPDSPQSVYAKPILIDETLKSGSANVHAVTGATITSNAFKASLESALTVAKSKNPKATVGIVKTTASSGASNTNSKPAVTAVQAIKITETPPADTTAPTVSFRASGTFYGNGVATPWGNTVASVTLANGRITNVAMPTIPNSPPSIQAQPFLIQQALSLGSANIQGVSGATVVSNAFRLSLESAIAQASAQGTVSASTTAVTTPVATPTRQRVVQWDDD